MNLAYMRTDYDRGKLEREDLQNDPFDQFTIWFKEACETGVIEPNAMTLSTAWADGRPSARTVLLKEFDPRGFVFFTNLESKKARQMKENPNVCLLFPWLALQRQVIVNGPAEKISTTEAVKYFLTRPRDSQLAAWASRQSSAITCRKVLEMEWAQLKQKFSQGEVPMPSFWGGYRVVPREVEFWQGRTSRLHDRFLYTRLPDNSWSVDRLAP